MERTSPGAPRARGNLRHEPDEQLEREEARRQSCGDRRRPMDDAEPDTRRRITHVRIADVVEPLLTERPHAERTDNDHRRGTAMPAQRKERDRRRRR